MKEFNKQVTNVFITNDYTKFKLIHNNREVNGGIVLKIQKIMIALAKMIGIENAFLGCIVVVKRKDGLYILDGQHRFEAAKGANIPIRYELREMSDEEFHRMMIEMNSVSHIWTNTDYANSHAKSSKPEVSKTYKLLLELKNEFKLTFTNLLHLIQDNKNTEAFRNGTLTIPSVSTLKKRIAMLIDYREALGVDKSFVLRGLIDVINKKEYAKNHDKMLRELKRLYNTGKLNVDKEVAFKNTVNKVFNNICNPKIELPVKRVYNLKAA
jgi:hypothetical protein